MITRLPLKISVSGHPTFRFKTEIFALSFLISSNIASSVLGAEVNVYSAREMQLVSPVFEAFTAKTGIKVNTIYIKEGLEERIKAEGVNSPADVILLVDAAKLIAASDMGLTQPVTTGSLETAVPSTLRDPAGNWFAVTQRSRIVYASRDRVAQSAITYEELADPKWKGRICIRSGQHPYNISLFAAAIDRLGPEKATEWLKGLKANLARKPSGGDRDVAKDILAGVCDIGIANTYYLGLMRNSPDPDQRAWGEAVKALDSTFGGGGTHVNISGAAVAKNAPNRESAIQLIEFLVDEKAQNMLATLNYEYPVRQGTDANATIGLFGPVRADGLSLSEIASFRRQASEIVDQIGFDQ
ncbi:MAG: extracellular solute-binding protein [Hyphomicrobiales bacterium]